MVTFFHASTAVLITQPCVLRGRLYVRFRIRFSVRFPIRFHANRMKIRFSVRHENRASTSTILLHPICHPIPCCPIAQALRMWFPKFGACRILFNLSTISCMRKIGGNWCQTGNRTENRMGIQIACKSERESDAESYI
jgi:hypothetical protein